MRLLPKTILNITLILLLTSCSVSYGQAPEITQQSTLEPEPLYETIEDTNEAVNDGILSLTIEKKEAICYHNNELIPIILTFKNISHQPIVLQSRFIMSDKKFGTDGDILVWLNKNDGTPLLSPGDTLVDEEWMVTPIPFTYQTLDGLSEFKTELEYSLPNQVLVGNRQDEGGIFTPGPGQYLIRIIYRNGVPHRANEWSGLIASNRIEICIID